MAIRSVKLRAASLARKASNANGPDESNNPNNNGPPLGRTVTCRTSSKASFFTQPSMGRLFAMEFDPELGRSQRLRGAAAVHAAMDAEADEDEDMDTFEELGGIPEIINQYQSGSGSEGGLQHPGIDEEEAEVIFGLFGRVSSREEERMQGRKEEGEGGALGGQPSLRGELAAATAGLMKMPTKRFEAGSPDSVALVS